MWSKRIVHLLGVVIMVVSLCTAVYIHDSWVESHTKVEQSWFDFSDDAALRWVDAFTQRDFATCDNLVIDQDSRLYAPLVLTLSSDDKYYDFVLKGLVNCISSVKLVSVDGDTYQLVVSLTKYNQVTAISSDSIIELREKFLDGGIEELDFLAELSDIYFELFEKTCFSLGTESVDVVAVLRHVDVNGVVYVTGTSEFVDLLLSESCLLYNISVFESDIKAEITSILEE